VPGGGDGRVDPLELARLAGLKARALARRVDSVLRVGGPGRIEYPPTGLRPWCCDERAADSLTPETGWHKQILVPGQAK